MARQYKTGLIITGDASGGIRAIRTTDKELSQLNKGFDRGGRRSRQFAKDVAGSSRELRVLRRGASIAATALAGVFAVRSLQGQVDYADQLQKTNIRIGASTEALSQYSYVAKLSGVQFNQLTTGWQRQTRRIAQAAQGTGEASEALKTLGLNAKELAQMAPEDQFEAITAAMQGVTNEAQKVALAQKLWDSEGVALLQIASQGTAAVRELREEADRLGLTISQQTASDMAAFNDEMDRMRFAAQGVSQSLLTSLIPSLTEGLQAASMFTGALRAGELDGVATTMRVTAGAVGGVATAYLAVRGALIVATGAQWAFNTAVRANPLMLAVSAAGALAGVLLTTRDRMSEVERQARSAAGEVRSLAEGFQFLTQEQQRNSKLKVVEQLTEWRLAAGELGAEIVKLERLQRQSGQLSEHGGALEIITPEQLNRGRQARAELAALMSQIGAGAETLKEMDAILEGGGIGGGGLLGGSSNKDADQLEQRYKSIADQLARQIALHGETSRVSQLRYEIEVGNLRDITDARKDHLIALGSEIDSLVKRDEMLKRIDQIKHAPAVGAADASIGGAFGEFSRIEQQRAQQQAWYAEQIAMLRTFKDEEGRIYEEAARRISQLEQEQVTNSRINQMQSQATLAAGAAQTLDRISSMTAQGSALNQTLFAVSKGFLIAQTMMQGKAAAADIMIQGQVAAAKAIAMNPMGGQGLAGTLIAQAAGQAAMVQGMAVANAAMIGAEALVGLTGQAHRGIDNIPREGTWLLDGGERVIEPRTNRVLEKRLRQWEKEDRGGGARSGEVKITYAPVIQVEASPGATERDGQRLAQGLDAHIKTTFYQLIHKEQRPGGALAKR